MRKPPHSKRKRLVFAGSTIRLGFAASASALALMTGAASAQISTGGIGFGNILPNVGVDPRMGDLRPQLESFLNPAAPIAARPTYLIQPSIDGQVGVTDNALRQAAPRRADVFTVISPSIAVSGDTRLLQVNLAYSPQAVIYANTSSQNQVYQYFNGQALATIVPNAVFVDVRGAITESSLTSGFNQPQTQSLNRNDTVQTTTFEVSPYVQHRFGGLGTGELRLHDRPYVAGYAGQPVQQPGHKPQLRPARVRWSRQSHHTAPRSGDLRHVARDLGRYNVTTNIDRQCDPVCSERHQLPVNAYRHEVQNEVAYAISHKVQPALAGFGYQDLFAYGGARLPADHYSGPSYNFGFALRPHAPTPS